MKDFIETWEIHSRINQYLLDAVDESSLADVAAAKGRSVGEQFAHLHNVRLMWLKAAAPELLAGQTKIEKGEPVTKARLLQLLGESSEAMKMLLEKGLKEGKVKNFKPNAAAFLGYLISHESHHRGQIVATLKQAGHKPDAKILFGMWEWGSR